MGAQDGIQPRTQNLVDVLHEKDTAYTLNI